MNRWFRLYDELLDDPKVQRLPAEDFRAYINLLCLASRNEGRLPDFEAIAFALRMDNIGARSVVDRLLIAGLIDRVKGGPIGWYIAPHGWEKRQYKSDTSTERVKRFRDRSKTVSETPPDTETDTDTEPSLREGARKRASRLPADWKISDEWRQWAVSKGLKSDAVEAVASRFANYWQSKAGKDAAKLDWLKTWQNWVDEELERKPALRGEPAKAAPKDHKLVQVPREDRVVRPCVARWRREHDNKDPKGDLTHVWLPEEWVSRYREHFASMGVTA